MLFCGSSLFALCVTWHCSLLTDGRERRVWAPPEGTRESLHANHHQLVPVYRWYARWHAGRYARRHARSWWRCSRRRVFRWPDHWGGRLNGGLLSDSTDSAHHEWPWVKSSGKIMNQHWTDHGTETNCRSSSTWHILKTLQILTVYLLAT